MVKHLLFTLSIVVLSSLEMRAQQPADCANCVCNIPTAMTGTTLYGSAEQPVCDPNMPAIFNVDVSEFLKFFAETGKRYTVSLCSNSANTMLYITTNTTVPGIINCDDDACGTVDGPSAQSFIPMQNNIYRIYVFNDSCAAIYPGGTMMDITITCTPIPPPPNDNPCGAIALPMNTTECTFIEGNNISATNSSNSSLTGGIGNVPIPACFGASYQGSDVWYTTQVPASGLIGIYTQENSLCAGAFELYTATNCANGPGFTPIPNSCTTAGLGGGTSEPARIVDAQAAGLAPGTTVYIRYWERNGNENGNFSICAFDGVDFVGIDESSADRLFSIYPNPNNGGFTLVNNGFGPDLDLQLIDAAGRTVHRQALRLGSGATTQIDPVAEIAPGLYRVQITSGDVIRSLPMVVR